VSFEALLPPVPDLLLEQVILGGVALGDIVGESEVQGGRMEELLDQRGPPGSLPAN
jgi:hypothetical protein